MLGGGKPCLIRHREPDFRFNYFRTDTCRMANAAIFPRGPWRFAKQKTARFETKPPFSRLGPCQRAKSAAGNFWFKTMCSCVSVEVLSVYSILGMRAVISGLRLAASAIIAFMDSALVT